MRLLGHCVCSPSWWLCMLSTEVVYSHLLWIQLSLGWTFRVRVHLVFKNATEKKSQTKGACVKGVTVLVGYSRLAVGSSHQWAKPDFDSCFLTPRSHTAPFSLLCVSAGEACPLFGRNEGGIQSAEQKKKNTQLTLKTEVTDGCHLVSLVSCDSLITFAAIRGTEAIGWDERDKAGGCLQKDVGLPSFTAEAEIAIPSWAGALRDDPMEFAEE